MKISSFKMPVIGLSFMKGENFSQFSRYMLVGLVTNGIGYLIYILLTEFGAFPKIAVTLLYVVSSAAAFLANRGFTFDCEARIYVSGPRYIVVQALGYLINILIMFILVDHMNVDHRIVQAVAVPVVALFLFFASKNYVFSPKRSTPGNQLP